MDEAKLKEALDLLERVQKSGVFFPMAEILIEIEEFLKESGRNITVTDWGGAGPDFQSRRPAAA